MGNQHSERVKEGWTRIGRMKGRILMEMMYTGTWPMFLNLPDEPKRGKGRPRKNHDSCDT